MGTFEIEIIGSVYFLGTNEYCNLTATVIHLMPTGHKDPHPKLPNLDLSKWEIRWRFLWMWDPNRVYRVYREARVLIG